MQSNTTPVPNIIFDCYLKELKIVELKILLVIIRQTFGWKDNYTKSKRKEKDWISGSQLTKKTGTSKRAINEAIKILVQKKLIEVLSFTGENLDTPQKRRGQQKLYYRPACAIFSLVDTQGNNGLNNHLSKLTNANYAEDLRNKMHELTHKMRITKETIQN